MLLVLVLTASNCILSIVVFHHKALTTAVSERCSIHKCYLYNLLHQPMLAPPALKRARHLIRIAFVFGHLCDCCVHLHVINSKYDNHSCGSHRCGDPEQGGKKKCYSLPERVLKINLRLKNQAAARQRSQICFRGSPTVLRFVLASSRHLVGKITASLAKCFKPNPEPITAAA